MSRYLDIIDKLQRINSPTVDKAMVAALPTADSSSLPLLALSLLDRRTDEGLLGLVLHFHNLNDKTQQMLIARIDRFDPILREASTSSSIQTKFNVVNIINRCGHAGLAYLLVDQLHINNTRLNTTAAETLLTIVRTVFMPDENTSNRQLTSDERMRESQLLISALAGACRCFHKHRRKEILLAVACLAPIHDEQLKRLLLDTSIPGHSALTALILEADHPLICHAMLCYLGISALQTHVIKALGKTRVAQQINTITSQSHLLIVPEIYEHMHRLGRVEHLMPDEILISRMSETEKREHVRWVAALPASEERIVEVLTQLALDAQPLTRLACLRQLMAMAHPLADRAISVICFDAESVIAQIALRHLIRHRWNGLDTLIIRIAASNDTRIKKIAEKHLAPSSFERLWNNWSNLSKNLRTAMARALIKIDRQFLQQLANKIENDDPEVRFKVLSIISQLNYETYFEKQLLTLAEDSIHRVASSAVNALGELGDSPTAVTAVEKALKHENDRVRSNAIEALEKMNKIENVKSDLINIASNGGNRSRATAINALVNMPVSQCLPTLLEMLNDKKPEHRISALWVISNMNQLTFVNQIAEIAKNDPVTRIRHRAMHIIREIVAANENAKPEKDKKQPV